MRKIIAATLLGISLAAPAGAQSLYGPGGLFLNPTAAMSEPRQVTPAFLILPQHNPVEDVVRTWQSFSLDFGNTRDLETGATYLKVGGWEEHPNASAGGFAKYRFLRADRGRGIDAAAGFTMLGGGSVDAQVGFLALRKPVQLGKNHSVVGHLGVEYIGDLDGISRHEFEPYAGLELGILPQLSFSAEARPRGRAEFATPMALTLAYKYGGNGRLAVTWANNGLSDRPMFGFGAGLTIGGRR